MPQRVEIRDAADEMIRIAIEAEDQYGITILTRAIRKELEDAE